MRIEIRKLALNSALSEETNCYTAEVWIDGERAFLASNRGHGGADDYHQVGAVTEQEVDAWLRANRPVIRTHGVEIAHTLEIEVGDLIEEEEQLRALRRRCRSHVVTIEDGSVFSYPLKGRAASALATMIKVRKPGTTIVNDAGENVLRTAARAIIAAARLAEASA